MIFDKETDVGNDPISVCNDISEEKEIIDKFNELRTSILNILIERTNIVF